LRGRDVATLLPLRARRQRDGADGRPNEVVPAVPGTSLDGALEAVAAVDPGALAAGIDAAERAGHPAAPWRAVARDPARWLRAYVEALRRTWAPLEPLWTRSADLLDRDVERVSVALARGAGPELIAQRYPYCAIAGDTLLLPSHSGAPGRLRAGVALQLQPLLAPVSAAGWTDDYADVCLAVRYSVPQAWRAFDDPPPPPASLEALLGPQRARILLRLDTPATPGELAALLHAVPSMATHHLRLLEAAGLVARLREGRHVRVQRTARGTELVALYERG
jgi:DNA-binding transcriptional ArsR family regulator